MQICYEMVSEMVADCVPLMLLAFEKTLRICFICKPAPVQCREHEYDLLKLPF